MVVLDATVVNIALPSAQKALGFSDANRQWIVTAYSLTFGSLLLLFGRFGDLFGRKRTLIVGLVAFGVVSAIGGAAQSFGMLVTARAFQGAAGALLAPSALSLLTTTFTEPRERGIAFGDLRRDRRRRRSRGPAARRRADRVPVMALVSVRERGHRGARRSSRAMVLLHQSGSRRASEARRARCSCRVARSVPDRLRVLAGRAAWVDATSRRSDRSSSE